jgi:predicted nucleic acid-binding protein
MGQMLMDIPLLDSVILIDHFNNIPQATAYLKQVRKYAFISVITRAEVLTGYDDTVRTQYANFLNKFQILEITTPIADLAASLRREYGWKLPDALQAALAKHHKLKLATRNTKDFLPERHNFVIVPYTRGFNSSTSSLINFQNFDAKPDRF